MQPRHESGGIDPTTWEAAAYDRGHWRLEVKTGMIGGEDTKYAHESEKREKRKQNRLLIIISTTNGCGRDCHARVGMYQVHNCHDIKSCHPPVKQYSMTHHNTEFIIIGTEYCVAPSDAWHGNNDVFIAAAGVV